MMINDQEMKLKFGQRLQAERERLGVTIAAFADGVGCARCCQTDYEQGVIWPGADYIQKAIDLGLDVANLFGVSGPQATGGDARPAVRDAVENMLALMAKQTDSLDEMLRVVDLMQVFLKLDDKEKQIVEFSAKTIGMSSAELAALKD